MKQKLRERDRLGKGSFHAQTLIMENKQMNRYNASFKFKADDLAFKEEIEELHIPLAALNKQ